MIQYKLKWARLVNGRIQAAQSDLPFDSYQDAKHAIKLLHSYNGEPYELEKVLQAKGFVQFHNPKTQAQFVITWTVVKAPAEPKAPKKKPKSQIEQLFV